MLRYHAQLRTRGTGLAVLLSTALVVTLTGCGSEQDKDRKVSNKGQPASSPNPSKEREGDGNAEVRRKPVKVGIPSGQPGTGQAPGCVAPLSVELSLDPESAADPAPYLTARLDAACLDRGQAVLRLAVTSEVRLGAALSCSRVTDSVFNFSCSLDGSAFRVGDTIAIPVFFRSESATTVRAEIEFPDPSKTVIPAP